MSLTKEFFNPNGRLTLIAGPCQMESEDHAMFMADGIKEIAQKHDIPVVYKSSFDKANRTSIASARGLGLEASMAVFDKIRHQFDMPTITDIHASEQCAHVAAHVDVLQIPAFLCRQTDLLVAAAKTGLTINVKKGQFLSPYEMKHVAAKLTKSGLPANKVLLCERGTSFGYNNLVNDFKGLPVMKALGHPVIFDATHSVMQPGGLGDASGGHREMVPVLARAAVAVGVAGVFMEVHQDPDSAPSDGPNMLPLDQLDSLLSTLVKFDDLAKAL